MLRILHDDAAASAAAGAATAAPTAGLALTERGASSDLIRALGAFLSETAVSPHATLSQLRGDDVQPAVLPLTLASLTAHTGLSLIESLAAVASREGIDTSELIGDPTVFLSCHTPG